MNWKGSPPGTAAVAILSALVVGFLAGRRPGRTTDLLIARVRGRLGSAILTPPPLTSISRM